MTHFQISASIVLYKRFFDINCFWAIKTLKPRRRGVKSLAPALAKKGQLCSRWCTFFTVFLLNWRTVSCAELVFKNKRWVAVVLLFKPFVTVKNNFLFKYFFCKFRMQLFCRCLFEKVNIHLRWTGKNKLCWSDLL